MKKGAGCCASNWRDGPRRMIVSGIDKLGEEAASCLMLDEVVW